MNRLRTFVFSSCGQYNRVMISRRNRAAATGLLELDELCDPPLVTRFDLRFPDLFMGETGHTLAAFLRFVPTVFVAEAIGRSNTT